MSATQLVYGAQRLARWILGRLDSLEFPRTDREFLAALCFDVVIEHHDAATLLIKNNINATAFALPRLVFDAFVRGCWLVHCATDAEIEKYRNDNFGLKFHEMLERLEAEPAFADNVLSGLKTQSWAAMNSYAHSGMLQLSRRVAGNEITPSYDDDEKSEVLKLCGMFALMAFQQMAFLAGRGDLAEEALRLLRDGGPIP